MTEQREPVDQPVVDEPTDGLRWAPEPEQAPDPAATPPDPRHIADTPPVDRPQDDTQALQDAHDEGMPLPPEEPEPASTVPAAEPVREPEPLPEPEQVPVTDPEPEPAPDPQPGWHPVTEPEPAPGPATTPVPAPDLALSDPHPTAETMALPGVAPAPSQAIFRDSPVADETVAEPLSDGARKLAAERAARKEAREAALAASAPVAQAAPEPVVVHKRTNDKFLGSLGLFVLRIVVAAIFTVRGITMLTNLVETQEQFAQTLIPYPQVMAIVTGIALLLIALSLVLGLLTRVAGLGIVLIAGGALAFVLWGPWSPFVPGQPGFLGELELLLAAVGLVFLLLGAGGWSVDRSFRSARVRDKAERQMA